MEGLIIDDLRVGHTYTNKDITDAFKVAPQGGMRRSKKMNTLVLISNHVPGNNTYEDFWWGKQLHYTGMGQTGDQSIDRAQNKTLANSPKSDIDIHLFEVYKKMEYVYLGKVKLAGKPYTDQEPDINGRMRRVYKFPLEKLDDSSAIPREIIDSAQQEYLVKEGKKKTPEEIGEIAKQNSERNKQLSAKQQNFDSKEVSSKTSSKEKAPYRVVSQKMYYQDPFIAEYIKHLADGICQLCEKQAPFEVDGKPYLESHHIDSLSQGGGDTIENSIALCPNCHKKVQWLDQTEYKEYLKHKVKERSISNEKEKITNK